MFHDYSRRHKDTVPAIFWDQGSNSAMSSGLYSHHDVIRRRLRKKAARVLLLARKDRNNTRLFREAGCIVRVLWLHCESLWSMHATNFGLEKVNKFTLYTKNIHMKNPCMSSEYTFEILLADIFLFQRLKDSFSYIFVSQTFLFMILFYQYYIR